MARPQAIVRGSGGIVSEYMPTAPGTNPRVTIIDGAGGTVVASRLPDTVDAVSTTLSASTALGVRVLTVASATGITAGRQYRIGSATDPVEFVRVRSVSGTTINLYRPMRHAHASGTAFVGTYMAVTVTAAEASALFWDGAARWSWDSMTTVQPIETSVECVLRRLHRTFTIEHVAAYYPSIHRILMDEVDVEEWLDAAFDSVCLRLGGKFRVQTIRGSDALSEPGIYQAIVMAFDAVEANNDAVERWRLSLERALDHTLDIFAADDNQDGTIASHEGPRRGLVLRRTS